MQAMSFLIAKSTLFLAMISVAQWPPSPYL